VSELSTSVSHVREARTYSCISFFLLFCCWAKSLWLIWCFECLECFSMLVWFGMSGCRRKQWRDLIISPKRACLAQARWAETCPDIFTRGVARRPTQFWASERLAQARRVSPKRERAEVTVMCVNSHLGEGSSPERGPLAWAKSWARVLLVWRFPYPWMYGLHLIWLFYDDMRERNMHVWKGVWVMNDELEWLLACDEHEMVGYESNMIMRWIEILHTWTEYEELEWVWPGTWKELAIKVGILYIYMYEKCYLAVWICLVWVNA